MKKTRVLGIAACMAMLSLTMTSCGPKDADIKTAIEAKAATMPEMAGVTVDVKDGVVTLTGVAKDEAAKAADVAAIKEIKGVKSVVDNSTVAPPPAVAPPVEIAAVDPLTAGVKNATKDYPTVIATVGTDGVVTLTGELERAKLQKLMAGLNTLKPKKIDNKLTLK